MSDLFTVSIDGLIKITALVEQTNRNERHGKISSRFTYWRNRGSGDSTLNYLSTPWKVENIIKYFILPREYHFQDDIAADSILGGKR